MDEDDEFVPSVSEEEDNSIASADELDADAAKDEAALLQEEAEL